MGDGESKKQVRVAAGIKSGKNQVPQLFKQLATAPQLNRVQMRTKSISLTTQWTSVFENFCTATSAVTYTTNNLFTLNITPPITSEDHSETFTDAPPQPQHIDVHCLA